MPKEQIGSILVKRGLITPAQLESALRQKRRHGGFLGQTLTDMGYIDEESLTTALSEQLNIPRVGLDTFNFDPELVRLIPLDVAAHYNAIVLSRADGVLTVAMADPLNVNVIDELRLVTGCQVESVFSTADEIRRAIEKCYPSAKGDRETEPRTEVGEAVPEQIEKQALDAPIIKLVNAIINDGVRKGASDIHIEPEERGLGVRYRIDGVLHRVPGPSAELAPSIISRVKIMADMDIAERRLPQDGRIPFRLGEKEIELRVSSYPVIYGENIVMRVLDKSSALLSLEELGLNSSVLERFHSLITRPNGIIFVTGPTGCGKTTALYAALSSINSVDKNILTLEEPVEYRLEGIRQTQVNPKAGLTFATGLRNMLRQDPDIIMVGEVRDLETAQIAVRAALTGHLVFTTLHTNDAVGAVSRLVDMGVEPYLVSSSVIGVLAERLIRLVCPKCKKEAQVPPQLAQKLGLSTDTQVFEAVGCSLCAKTGYKGRTGIFELLSISDEIRALIVAKAPSIELEREAASAGMMSLRDDGLEEVRQGKTTISEVLRVT